jgi:hypothetical protein
MRALRGARSFGTAPDEFLDAFFKIAAGKENPMMARGAHHANVRAEPYHLPFVTAARVRLAEADHIVEIELERHSVEYYSIVIIPLRTATTARY